MLDMDSYLVNGRRNRCEHCGAFYYDSDGACDCYEVEEQEDDQEEFEEQEEFGEEE